MLHYYGREQPYTTSFERGVQTTLQTEATEPIDFYSETFENYRFSGDAYSQLFRDYLRQKYAGRKIDVIIAVTDGVVDFLLRYRDEVFPGVPVVVVTSKQPEAGDLRLGITGVWAGLQIRDTLELALKLHPGTRQVAIVEGKLNNDGILGREVREQVREFEGRVAIDYLTDLTMDQLLARVKDLKNDAIILLVRQTKSGPDTALPNRDALVQLAHATALPIYGCSDQWIGYGVAGGYVNSSEGLGAQAARIALRIADGARARDIPIESATITPMFDGRQLRRLGISESQLPPGSVVQFKEWTFWQLYKWQIAGVALLVGLQTFLIAVLLIERSRRRRTSLSLAESEEKYRDVVETQTELICRFRPDTTLTFVNDAYCRYFNRTRAELIGTKFIELLPPAGRNPALQYYSSLATNPLIEPREHEVVRADGSRGWQQWVNHVITNGGGRVVELQGIGRDVTARKLAEKELKTSEERFAKAFKANPQPMSLTTLAEGRYIDVNESFLLMSGYGRAQVIGHTSTELGVWETPADRARFVQQLISQKVIRNLETRFRTKSGVFRALLSSAELIEIGGEECILLASSDITERKHLEEELRRSEREFSTLVENSPDVITRLDRELRYIYISPALERISGVATYELIGKTPEEVALPGYDSNFFETGCREAFTTGQTVVREFTFEERKYRTRIIPEFSPDSSIDSVMTISEDVTERLRAEQELLSLTARLFTLQDEERRRIARELHDGAAQNLFGITINLGNLEKQKSNTAETSRLIDECQSLAEQSLQEVRTFSYLLHPPILDQAGLALALQWYVEGFTKRSGIYVDLIVIEDIGRLPLEVETALFRIVQESLTNIRRHSGSETASIRLEKKAGEVLLEIADHGSGMPTNGGADSVESIADLGVGIPGMRQRLRQLGGRLQIESTGEGTTVIAVVPGPEGNHNGDHLTG